MPNGSAADGRSTPPSITAWTRLEPLVRNASMQASLQAQARDPLWFLARQYQLGEFLADDAGSPLHASVMAEFRNVTTYCPGTDPSKTKTSNPAIPVEVHAERESVTLRLHGAVQFGRIFERMIRQNANINQPDQVIQAFRKAFPVSPSIPDAELASPDAVRLRSIVGGQVNSGGTVTLAGRVVNGVDLYAAALAIQKQTTPVPPMPTEANDSEVQKVLAAFVSFRQSVFCEPDGDSAWEPTDLRYDFALGSPATNQNMILEAKDFPGGRVDWYSFSLQNAPATTVSTQNPAAIKSQVFDLLPNHVVFRGMPDSRWWNFEDGATDLGQSDAEQVDLPKLLVIEFALIYGNDWFSIPIPVPVGNPKDPSEVQGTISRIDTLVVTDTFGVRTLILPAEQTQVNTGEAVWSMYKLSGQDSRSNFILLPPTLGLVQDASALEDVLLLRDDMAAMAWAVEQHLQGDMDSPVDAVQAFLQNPAASSSGAPAHTAGGPDIYYGIENLPPFNWVPMVPVVSNQGAPYLRRGALEIPDPTDATKIVTLKAHALILDPNSPFYVVDHAVPRAGTRVSRYFRFTRSFYGTSYLWQARKSGLGAGVGWSGLRFDTVRDIPKNAKP